MHKLCKDLLDRVSSSHTFSMRRSQCKKAIVQGMDIGSFIHLNGNGSWNLPKVGYSPPDSYKIKKKSRFNHFILGLFKVFCCLYYKSLYLTIIRIITEKPGLSFTDLLLIVPPCITPVQSLALCSDIILNLTHILPVLPEVVCLYGWTPVTNITVQVSNTCRDIKRQEYEWW